MGLSAFRGVMLSTDMRLVKLEEDATGSSSSSTADSSTRRLRVCDYEGIDELVKTSSKVSLDDWNITDPADCAREGPCVRVNRFVLYPSVTSVEIY